MKPLSTMTTASLQARYRRGVRRLRERAKVVPYHIVVVEAYALIAVSDLLKERGATVPKVGG